jgi:hypothetical protein
MLVFFMTSPVSNVLEVPRHQPLQHTRIVTETLPLPEQGQITLAVERFGLSANNLSYALLGDMLGHWTPFPAAAGWGRVPAWGVGTVLVGDPAVAPVGARYLGYLPMATHVGMRAVDARPGLRDVSSERASMLPMYRQLRRVDTDPTWDDALIDAEVLMQPVYPPAGLLDDDLRRAGTQHVIISSASSKTSMGMGRLLVERGVHVTGLSRGTNTRDAASVGAFDQVLPYDDLSAIPLNDDTTYVDVAGDPAITRAVHERLGARLSHSIAVGGSHLAALGGIPAPDPNMPGPMIVRFSVGQRETELTGQHGRDAVDEIKQNARRKLVPWADEALTVQHLTGLQAAQDAWDRIGRGSLAALNAITVTP